MKLDNRIARLERALREMQVGSSESKGLLMQQLVTIAERNAGECLDEAWCAGQSPITIAAMCFHELETGLDSPALWHKAENLCKRKGGPTRLFVSVLEARHAA